MGSLCRKHTNYFYSYYYYYCYYYHYYRYYHYLLPMVRIGKVLRQQQSLLNSEQQREEHFSPTLEIVKTRLDAYLDNLI